MGELLIDARQACREIGVRWYEWLAETGLGPDAAEKLMNLFKFIRSLDPDQVDIVRENISIKAFYLLAAPSTTPETREEIFQRAERGEQIHSGMVRQSRRGAPPFRTQTRGA
jgi:hypothetical protein